MNASAQLVSPAIDLSGVEVRTIRGTEALGRLYQLEITLVAKELSLGNELLQAPLTLELFYEGSKEPRRIHGIASQIHDHLTATSPTPHYRLTFVPRMWRLSLTLTSEIFMAMTVSDIISAKLDRYRLDNGIDYEMRLQGSYPELEYVVQYQETDLQFVKRLAEHWGITLFFEQQDEREVVVFTDHADGFKPLGENGIARFIPRGEHAGVFDLSSTTSTLPTQYAVKDYNYRTPQVALLAAKPIADGQVGHNYAYGDHFRTEAEAKLIAHVRAEEVACTRTQFEGCSTEMAFAPGSTVKLEGHPLGEPVLLITEVVHDFTQTVMMHGATDAEHGYKNSFGAIHASTLYRPPRVTAKPRIYGSITAQIESSGDGPYAELDADGRYHVRFMFDIGDGKRAQATRLVRMAQPHTGPGYGFHFPLRHGVEVLITFIDGDPDRPIISAAVPNPQTPSVVTANNGARNIIRTGGGNEINLDDTVGSERIKLSTPYGGSSFQIGAPNSPSAGAALSTADAWNAVAEGGVTTASTTVSLFSDITSISASADIVAFAGAANIMKTLAAKAPGLAAKVAKVIDGSLDVAEKQDQATVTEARDAAQTEREAAQKERSRKDTWEDGECTGPTPFDAKIDRHEANARAHDSRADKLEAVKAFNDGERAETKKLTKATGELAAAKDAWSVASNAASKAQGTCAATAAAMAAASGSGFAAAGRIGGSVPSPGSPKNIQAAANSAALIGLSNAMVAGINTGCVGSAQAILAGGGKALVKSPGQAEIAGMVRCLMTSAALVDIKSFAVLNTEASGLASHKAGAAMNLTAGAALTEKAGAAMSMQAGAAMSMRAGASMSMQAGAAFSVNAVGSLKLVAAGDAHMKGAVARVNGKGGGKLRVQSGVTVFGDKLVVKAGFMEVKPKLYVAKKVSLGNKLEVKGAVTFKSTLKANGRVLLG